MAIRQNSCDAVARSLVVAAATTLAVLCMSMSVASARDRPRAGTLTCSSDAAIDLTAERRRPVRCHYVSRGGRTQSYAGVIARFEGDAAAAPGRFMQWSVVMAAPGPARGALAGRYVAAGGAGGTGAGANDLIGEAEAIRSIVLRPASSARGRSRFNVASGVKDLSIGHRNSRRENGI